MRLHDLLEQYLNALENAVAALPAYTENYSEEVLTPERVNVRIRLRFNNGNLLEIKSLIC